MDCLRKKPVPPWIAPSFCVCLCVTLAMTAIAMFTGQWTGSLHFFYSYELQAQNWLNGKLYIEDGENYTWLELAIYNGSSWVNRDHVVQISYDENTNLWYGLNPDGEVITEWDEESEGVQIEDRYFVSFPPFPSYVMLPFVALSGVQIADGWIAWMFAMLACIYAVRLYLLVTHSTRGLYLLTLFLLLSNGYLFLVMNGWVWFIAQNMCFALMMTALYHAESGNGGRSLICWACAVGCRPMSVLWFPLLAVMLVRAWRARGLQYSFIRLCLRKSYCAIGPLLIGGSYMLLNWLRFGSVVQFGHDYLPEFTRTATGQFDISYLLPNLLQYLTMPRWNGSVNPVSFSSIDGAAFYIENTILLVWAAIWVCAIIRKRGTLAERILNPLLVIAYILTICMHRTLGGVQFGNRYLVDVLPVVWLGILRWKPESDRFDRPVLALAVFGAAVQLIGTVYSYNNLF